MLEAAIAGFVALAEAAIHDALYVTIEAGDAPIVVRAHGGHGFVQVRFLAPGERLSVARELRTLVQPAMTCPLFALDPAEFLFRPWRSC